MGGTDGSSETGLELHAQSRVHVHHKVSDPDEFGFLDCLCENIGDGVSTLSALESKLARRQYLVNTKRSELHINLIWSCMTFDNHGRKLGWARLR